VDGKKTEKEGEKGKGKMIVNPNVNSNDGWDVGDSESLLSTYCISMV